MFLLGYEINKALLQLKRLKINREHKMPPLSIYQAIGYNENADDNKKHYRRFYVDELENNKEIFSKSPFTQCDIERGS